MDSRWLGVLVLIIIVAGGGWYVFSHPTSPSPAAVDTSLEQATTTDDSGLGAVALAPMTVTYTDNGFSPAEVTITEGQSVTWVNQSSEKMWIASGPHPSHTGYDKTSRSAHCATEYAGEIPFDECANIASGENYTFTFIKAGTWKYHNHSNEDQFGTIVVTAVSTSTSISASTTVNAH